MDYSKAHFAICNRPGMSEDDRHALYAALELPASSRNFAPGDWRRHCAQASARKLPRGA